MPSGTVGFKVNCGSDGSPGVDQLGTFTMLLSFKFSDMDKPVFVEVPINGQSETGAGDGDDTPQVAESAQAAVDQAAASGKFGGHGGSVSVEVDSDNDNGKGLGRVVVDDPKLELLDVSDNVGGKLDTEIVFVEGTKGPPKPFGGPLPDHPTGQGGWIHTKRGGTPEKAPSSGSSPTAGSKEWQFLNPNRPWHRPGPYKRRPNRKKKKDTQKSVKSGGESQGMILLGGLDSAPGVLIDVYTDIPVLCIPFLWDNRSMSSQNRLIRDSLLRAGVAAELAGESVAVGGIIGQPGSSFRVIGARPFATPMPGQWAESFPWDLVAGAGAEDGLLFVSARPSPLVQVYRASQVSVSPAIPPGIRQQSGAMPMLPKPIVETKPLLSRPVAPNNPAPRLIVPR